LEALLWHNFIEVDAGTLLGSFQAPTKRIA
jgi:hypothetical protein